MWDAWRARHEVAVRIVSSAQDAPDDEPLLVYGAPAGIERKHLLIAFDAAVWDGSLDPQSVRWIDHDGQPVADLVGSSNGRMVDADTPSRAVVSIDLIGCSYRIMRSDDEATPDEHGRPTHETTLIGALGLAHEPVVDTWFDALADAARTCCGAAVARRKPWGDAPFAFCATHDVDRVHRGWVDAVRRAKGLVSSGRWRDAAGTLRATAWGMRKGADLNWNLDELLQIDRSYGASPTFFLMASGGHQLDGDYVPTGRQWESVCSRIVDSGGEIALHGSYRSHADADVLGAERTGLARVVGPPVVGVRQHFLRHDGVRTVRAHVDAGFEYDATLGFVDQIGFRAGTSWPYPAFDAARGERVPLMELPLAVMDRTLERYLGLQPERVWEAVEPIMRTAERTGGCVVALWHNVFIVEQCYPGWRALYERMLGFARSRGALMTTCADACRRTAPAEAGWGE